MPIDYTKRPNQPAAPPAGAPAEPAETGGKVVLTKSAPSVSLTKRAPAGGSLRVNLNWNARTAGGGLFRKGPPPLDLDLGCLFEFTDGAKGVVQALGNSFTAGPFGASQPVIRLDGDDRSGAVSDGENLHIDLGATAQIRRILVFALIYEGAANWADAQGVVTLYPAGSAPIEIHLDEPRNGARICAVALLENQGGELVVRREVRYLDGAQRALDEAYSWGMRWTAGRK